MIYSAHLTDNRNIVGRYLAEPQNENEWLGSDTLYCRSVIFNDGYMMDIKICGVDRYEDGGCNTAWTEAVLFNPKCYEVACTEVCEDFFGKWKIEYDGNEYIVTIEEE